jgi:hypothetical protein
MTDESARRLERLAQRAKELDNMIVKAAEMQKRIVDDIRRIGQADKFTGQQATATRKPGRKAAVKARSATRRRK